MDCEGGLSRPPSILPPSNVPLPKPAAILLAESQLHRFCMQVLGPRQAMAQMLADTIRAAAAGAGGGGQGAGTQVPLRLGGGCALRFSLTSRRSVQFSRAEFLALAQDGRASRRWNAFVGAARAAWSEGGKEGSRAERLRQLLPLLAPESRR